jgi:hypothetical protein
VGFESGPLLVMIRLLGQALSLETHSNLSKDHQEAVWAFAQKRRPSFTGR